MTVQVRAGRELPRRNDHQVLGARVRTAGRDEPPLRPRVVVRVAATARGPVPRFVQLPRVAHEGHQRCARPGLHFLRRLHDDARRGAFNFCNFLAGKRRNAVALLQVFLKLGEESEMEASSDSETNVKAM